MRTLNLAPLHRATVGFDQITDMMDRILQGDAAQQSYPPYNIEKTADDGWRISIAVAGFGDEDLHVEVVKDGKIVYDSPSIEDMRKVREQDIAKLDPGVRRIVNPHIYHVSLSQQLWDLKQNVLKKMRR